jgi:hypothetical protein
MAQLAVENASSDGPRCPHAMSRLTDLSNLAGSYRAMQIRPCQ